MPDKLIITIEGENQKFINALKGSEKELNKFGQVTAGVGKAAAIALGGVATAAAVGTAAALGTAAFKGVQFADQVNSAMSEVGATSKLTGDQLEDFKQQALDVFQNNWGESFEDAAKAMQEVQRQLNLSGDALEDVTTKAIVLRERFEVDIPEGIQAVDTLMEQFGLTSDEAFNFIATGFQRGLNSSDDFLDSIREYSNLFGGEGKASAAEFFSLLETGLQGGVLGTDKAADAFKEFQIRLLDGSSTTADALTALGVNTDDFFSKIATGEITAIQAFDMIIGKLGEISDPMNQNQLGVDLLGTQFEDMGARAATAIDINAVKMDDMAGAIDRATASNQGLGTAVDQLGRDFLVAIEPAAQEILPLLNDGLEIAGDFMDRAQPIFAEFGENMTDTVGPAVERTTDALTRIAKAIGIATDDASGMDVALKILDGTLDFIVGSIDAVSRAVEILANAIEKARGAEDFLTNVTGVDVGRLRVGAQLLGFDKGGVVPGPIGAPRMAMVHGGEGVFTPEQMQNITYNQQQFNLNVTSTLPSAGIANDFRMMQALL